ncbi:osteocrin [Tiliqua scincoides]|uniref:osteocrin n=1 Tax=Tiliqua scincoides TaxID=71010 RepID=UPI003462D5B8
MPACQQVTMCLLLAITLFQWQPGIASHAEPQQEQPLDSSLVLGVHPPPRSSGGKSSTDLAAKLLLLDELVSLENDATETKKKRSFPGFGSPLDRLSAGSVDLKANQRKVVELPKRRFRLPLDRLGTNRLSNSRG